MNTIDVIIIGLIGFTFGMLFYMIISKKRCKHSWNLIESGKITRGSEKVGIYKTYECNICKKLKDEKTPEI